MPFKSQAQRGLFYAAAEGKVPGIPRKTAKKMIADDEPGNLPKHKRKKAKHSFKENRQRDRSDKGR